jgi:hypothetical protein
MVNMRNNHCNGQANNANNNNLQMEQLLATQNQLMQAVLQALNQLQPNPQAQQQHQPPPPQSRLGEFLRTRPTTFSQAKDPMEVKDWLMGVEKKLVIAQWTDHEKVLFVVYQLYGMAANRWETYCNTHANIDTIMWNEFKAHFHTHYEVEEEGIHQPKARQYDSEWVPQLIHSVIKICPSWHQHWQK